MNSLQLEIDSEILSEYGLRVSELTLGKANHFFGRALAIRNDQEFKDILAACLLILKRRSLKKSLERTVNGPNMNPRNPGTANDSVISTRKSVRTELYQKYPEVSHMNSVLNDLFFLKKYGLDKTFDLWKPLFEHAAQRHETVQYLSPEVLRGDSSFSVNSVFYLKHLGIVDLTPSLVDGLRSAFHDFDSEGMDDPEYTSMIYALTHVVIAASRYYEITAPEYAWASEYFTNHLDEISERVSLDVLSEVALSYRITETESRFESACERLCSDLISRSPFKKKRLSAEELNQQEHTNSILMLLFSDTDSFLPPPDLSSHPLFANKVI